jgi:bifunctional non-homologous end joining protein LigD
MNRRTVQLPPIAVSEFIPPCCRVPAMAVPVGHGWQHERNFDGYRVQIHKIGKDLAIYRRNGHLFTSRFETISYMLRELYRRGDDEIVASDRRGAPNFARLHLRAGSADGLHLWCFDLLTVNGRGSQHLPLELRQGRLQALLARFDCPAVRASEAFTDGVKCCAQPSV